MVFTKEDLAVIVTIC